MSLSIEKYYFPLNYGLQDDIPYDEYFRLPAINCSAIKYGFRSPYHMDMYLQGNLREDKSAYSFGNCFHQFILENDKFKKETYIMPEMGPDDEKWDMRKKLHKELREHHLIEANGRELITPSDYEKMQMMKESLYKHNIARKIMDMKGYNEKTILWKNVDLDINCKGKLDRLIPESFICDLKTTKDASPYGFLKDFEKYQYKVQAAVYTDGLMSIGYEELPFIFIAIEHSPPYYCNIYEVSQEKINEGRKMYVSKLKEYIDYKNNRLDLMGIHVI